MGTVIFDQNIGGRKELPHCAVEPAIEGTVDDQFREIDQLLPPL
jgi:hypothetical protein